MPVDAAAAPVEDGLVTLSEAAAFLRVSRSTVYALVDRGILAYAKIGRSMRVPKRALIELVARELRGGVLL
jgi:excisionase family DNA binding protein